MTENDKNNKILKNLSVFFSIVTPGFACFDVYSAENVRLKHGITKAALSQAVIIKKKIILDKKWVVFFQGMNQKLRSLT